MDTKKLNVNAMITPEQPLSVMVISPLYDIPTVVSSKMANQLTRVLNSHPLIKVDRLHPFLTSPRSIEKALARKHYPLIIYYGHGKKDVWFHGLWKALADEDDSYLFKGSIVTTMACYSAEIFGETLVRAGAKAYIGNINEVFGAYNLWEYPYATDFVRVWQNEAIDLLRGFTVAKAVSETKANLYRLAAQYRNNPDLPSGEKYARKCEFNADNHIYRGDGNAMLPAVIKGPEELDLRPLGIEY